MTVAPSTYRFFAAASPGLESLLQAELEELGIAGDTTPGGVDFKGPLETLWTCSAKSRLAESIRLRLKSFKATSFYEFERGLARLPWHAYVRPHRQVEVRVSCSESRLYHTAAIEERLRTVLSSLWRNRTGNLAAEQANADPVKLQVRIVRNEVGISVDATGTRLHRRGYRTHVGDAPLRETLAAAACRLLENASQEEGPLRLWDPCCGSGTLLCEWLLLKAATWPALTTGHLRRFAFESWPIHPSMQFESWKQQLAAALPDTGNVQRVTAYGSDIDARVLDAARHNLEQARVATQCTLLHSDFRTAANTIPKNTALVTNLPYGVRLKESSAKASPFFELDALLQERADLRPAVVISTELPPRQTRNGWKPAARFSNGGLAVSAWLLA